MSNVIDPLNHLADRSPDNQAMLPYWDLTDDIVKGLDAMVLAGKAHMPKFPGEEKEEYEFRLANAKMTNIYRDIVEGLSQKPFEEEVSLVAGEGKTIPEQISNFCEDVDGTGNNLTGFSNALFFNGINSAVAWILVDFSKAKPGTPPVATRADEIAAGVRPFWSYIAARNMLEIKSQVIGDKEYVTYARILEPGNPNYVRVMEMDGSIARWTLYKEENTNTTTRRFVIDSSGVFTIGVIPLVAFTTGRRDGKRQFYYPAMRDAADLQKNLYRNESSLEFAKILTAFPMLVGQGVNPPKDENGKPQRIAVGPARVLYAPPNAQGGAPGSWVYIEPSATSLTFLSGEIEKTQQQIRELGRQPLTAQSGQLTVISAATAASKARSAVSAWALALKNALENAMVLTCKWMRLNVEYDPEISVFTEFDDFADAGADLEQLGAARERGDISQLTYWTELKRRKVLSPEFNADAEIKRLLDEGAGDEDEIDPETGRVVPKA